MNLVFKFLLFVFVLKIKFFKNMKENILKRILYKIRLKLNCFKDIIILGILIELYIIDVKKYWN